MKHVIGTFKPTEEAELKKAIKKSVEAMRLFVSHGLEAATQFANTR